jgi:hypothetical protein
MEKNLLELIKKEEEKQLDLYDKLNYYEDIIFNSIDEDDILGQELTQRDIDIVNEELSKSISLVDKYKKELKK